MRQKREVIYVVDTYYWDLNHCALVAIAGAMITMTAVRIFFSSEDDASKCVRTQMGALRAPPQQRNRAFHKGSSKQGWAYTYEALISMAGL